MAKRKKNAKRQPKTTSVKRAAKPVKVKRAVKRVKPKAAKKAKTKHPRVSGKVKLKKKSSFRYHSPLAKKPPPGPKAIRFKKVRHPQDGLGIQFRIPTTWKQTWGSEDNSLFYPPLPDHPGPNPVSGKLFVRFRTETVGQANDGAAFGILMAHRTDPTQTVTQLDSGAFMLHFQARHHTEGFNAVDYYWILSMPLPPRKVAIASFLFSGIAEIFDGEKAPKHVTIEMLEKEIPHAIFDREILPVNREDHIPSIA